MCPYRITCRLIRPPSICKFNPNSWIEKHGEGVCVCVSNGLGWFRGSLAAPLITSRTMQCLADASCTTRSSRNSDSRLLCTIRCAARLPCSHWRRMRSLLLRTIRPCASVVGCVGATRCCLRSCSHCLDRCVGRGHCSPTGTLAGAADEMVWQGIHRQGGGQPGHRTVSTASDSSASPRIPLKKLLWTTSRIS